jgi:hypothetical protein
VKGARGQGARGHLVLWTSAPLVVCVLLTAGVAAQQPPAETFRSVAPIDLTGTWVSIVNEDWRWRMMTPPKGDYASVPLNAEARKVADAWDLATDEAAGESCKPFGVGNIMRMPGRMRVSWQDDSTMKVELDAGTQTRLLRFGSSQPPAERTWQGHSVASWEFAGAPQISDRNNIPSGPSVENSGSPLGRGRGRGRGAAPPPAGGALKVVTSHMREGHLRKNGVPYSQDAVVTEYFDRMTYPNGDTYLMVRTVVEDPRYLQVPFITSSHFKREPDTAKWNPTPCRIDPPTERGK